MIITVELPVLREQLRVLEELAAVAAGAAAGSAAVLLSEVGEVGVELLLGRGDRVVGGAVLAGGLELHTYCRHSPTICLNTYYYYKLL